MTFEILLPYILSAIIGVGGFLGKLQMNRIQTLEEKLEHKITEKQTRQILTDKLEPIKEGLDDVQLKLDKLYDLLLNRQ